MTDESPHESRKLSWRFPRIFWYANVAELFERAAFYGMFIALAKFLTDNVGFTDIETGFVAACFASVLYLLPMFMGAMADRVGFRPALMLAFAILTVGYTLLGGSGSETAKLLSSKIIAVISLILIMFGGAIIKPVISGTVAKCSDDDHRARAFSIFYQVVNIGAFMGKSFAAPLRQHLGLEYINYYAAFMAFLAFIFVTLYYRDVERSGSTRSFDEAIEGYIKVILNFRFMALILIVAGFWLIQGQLYASMTKYITRLLGEGAKPEWLANINPFVVVICVVPITHAVRKFKPENSIGIGLFIIPFTALVIGLSSALQGVTGNSITLIGQWSIHPITLVVIIGIGLQGLAECFLSPKFLEYASKQAPKGEEGLYLGYQHLTTFFAWFFGFIMSGYLLDAYCPDPEALKETDPSAYEQWRLAIETGSDMPEAYAHAHVMWFWFTGIGVAAFIGLLIFKYVTARIDRQRETTGCGI